MELLKKRLANLLCIKSIVTLSLTGTFTFLCVTGHVSTEQFLTIFTVVIGFYFGTQAGKRENAAAAVAKNATAAEEVVD